MIGCCFSFLIGSFLICIQTAHDVVPPCFFGSLFGTFKKGVDDRTNHRDIIRINPLSLSSHANPMK